MIRTLRNLHRAGGASRTFAEDVVNRLHAGNWGLAEDHWEQVVVRFLETKEMEQYSATRSLRQAEGLARNLFAVIVAAPGRCPECP